ncbi:DUF3040 domain-containing protein [Streptacidiphilus rugosus]|uniref:DUF3040 domain-containing protein n=1 Tax=Streptacidiphilus rugosus TaxID=405783 RepID=UPI00055D18AE|nr:DUF3040 domain-containing protein [Streptacidiphilus rugosus]
MLSIHNRRELAGIEEQLAAQQPDLARLLEGFDQWAPRRHRTRHWAVLWAWAVGWVALALAFAVHSAAVLLLAVLLLASSGLAAAVLTLLRRVRRRVRAREAAAGRAEPAAS